MNKNIIDFSKYDEFIAEIYEAKDQFFKELIEDLEADYVIDEMKSAGLSSQQYYK